MAFATPAWLLGLLLVPVIWYLHRSGPILRRHPVPSLALWNDSLRRAAQAGERRPPDPAWLRRAAIAALLAIALAGPQLRRPAERVTVWVDDSLSMQTMEHGASRLDRGMRLMQAALRDSAVQDVLVSPLSHPTRAYSSAGRATLQMLRSGAGATEPQSPAPDALDPSRAQWLVTDGADEAVNRWLAKAAVDRVFQVAATSRNVGIARVTVRPQPAAASERAILVLLRNGGSARATRTLELIGDSAVLASWQVSIDAGASAVLMFDAMRPVQRVTARLSPTDALPQDDVVFVDASSLAPLAVHVDESCPAVVTRAIGAHPALRVARGLGARLVVDCGSGWGSGLPLPRLTLHQGPPEPFDPAAVFWSRSAGGGPRQITGTLPPHTRGRLDAPRPADLVLLAAGETPLVIVRAGTPRVVETSLDLGSPEAAGSDAVPLLLAFLADAALDASLLERSAGFARGEAASMVAPRAVLTAQSRPFDGTHGGAAPLVLPFVLLAAALLAWEVLSLGRRLLREYGWGGRAIA